MTASPPGSPPSAPGRSRRGGGWIAAALLGAAVLLGLHAWSIESTWIEPSVAPPPPGVVGRTQWGGMLPEFQHPPRIFLDNDCYYWIRYAQEMMREGRARIRHTDLDNVPDGRAVHWSSPFSWWLVLCGGAESLVTGRPWIESIESAALWANPVLLLLALTVLAVAVRSVLGAARTAVFLLLLAALPGVQWAFGYGRPGHHGLHTLAALGGLLCLLLGGAGWIRSDGVPFDSAGADLPDRRTARRWFVAGGICGGGGLWIGATLQLVVFGSLGLGAVAAILLGRPTRGAVLDGGLWRRWGFAAALTSLLCYAIEYLPGRPEMRLEVNHPLYAAAFCAGGEFLARLVRWRTGVARPADRLMIAATALALLAVPAAVLVGPPAWHALRDPYMRRLHDHIMNFQPFITGVDAGAWFKLLREFALLPLLLPAAAWLVWRRRGSGPAVAPLLLVLVPALVLGAWTLHQTRWTNLFSPALAVLLLAVWRTLPAAETPGWRRPGRWLAALAVLPPVAMLGWSSALAQRQARAHEIDPFLGWAIASRDVAFNLKRLAQLGPVRVMSGPGQTPTLHFFGGVPGMGSLYWENIAGVHAAADFFADTGEADALRLVRARGITHIVVQQDPVLAAQMFWVRYGRPADASLRQTLAWRLADPLAHVPDWLEPVPYYGSPAAAAYQMRIYRVRLPAATPRSD